MSDNPAASEQVDPVHNGEIRIVDVVISDIVGKYGSNPIAMKLCNDLLDRAEVGFKRYGTYLQPNNGRDSLLDAYQELADGCKYLRNRLAEQPADAELYLQYHNLMDVALFVCGRLIEEGK